MGINLNGDKLWEFSSDYYLHVIRKENSNFAIGISYVKGTLPKIFVIEEYGIKKEFKLSSENISDCGHFELITNTILLKLNFDPYFLSQYIWFLCYMPENVVNVFKVNTESFKVEESIKLPFVKLGEGRIYGVLVFNDEVAIYEWREFGSDYTKLLALRTDGKLLWEENIKGGYLVPLTNAVVSLARDLSKIIFFDLLKGKSYESETDIKIADDDSRYGRDICSGLVEGDYLYTLWIEGSRTKEKKDRKVLLKLNLRNGKTVWNLQLDFVEPECIKK